MNPWYTDYSEYLSRFFGKRKIQKISVNTHSDCPNRDGTIGTGGCIYCNNRSFTPSYCFLDSDIRQQIESGKLFFGNKYPDMNYLVYFQSYTTTHKNDYKSLEHIFREALECDRVVGIITGTRPDCLPQDVIKLMAEINKEVPVFIEIGAETMNDSTLRLINRGHDSKTTILAVERLVEQGLHAGLHLIAGLPGEDKDIFLHSIEHVSRLPIESLKLHHLQVLKDTALHHRIMRNEMKVIHFTPEEYLDLCIAAIKIIPKHIAIERFLASAPSEMVVSPKWGLKNYQFTNLLHNRLKEIYK